MSAQVATALIAMFGGITVAGLSYWFTKQREREADWRKEKLEHYKDFVASLSGVISGEATPEGHRNFSRACNKMMLVAPQQVMDALHGFQQEIKISNKDKSLERHDALMSKFFFEIRKDLAISPSDDPETFKVWLWASGQKPRDP
ncbi:MAG: hypothetical protein HYT79_05530 [Elusimicrobia bacterium]|nr:hypothetical protein [Elusimicrobiota bacterium]